MPTFSRFFLSVFVFSLCALPVIAEENDPFDLVQESQQMKSIFNPSTSQLEKESEQKVFMYAGLTDVDVERAMDENFDRIETFMFTQVVVTDASGQPERDELGHIVMEDDDC